ncbi:indoleamine 2,3-dioxygenase 1 [Latimeria chalumnae]|uniref:indoleamine 2,3-dioxygenase 1 n=1 Tax=Latimeria chalumnae TaxID=7897 RepID=UPI00313CCA43
METDRNCILGRTPTLSLRKFHISEDYGFICLDPVAELPDYYQPWMKIAKNLPYLIENSLLRCEVNKMPLLTTDHLKGHRELRLAHLALSFITMGYVWQEGERDTIKVLPRSLAKPFCEISQTLGLPPIMVHADCVLANWKKKKVDGPLEIENLDTILSLPGGESSKGFFLVTLLVEIAAVPGIKAISEIINAVVQDNVDSLLCAFQTLTNSIGCMIAALKQMHGYVDPGTFYGVIRIFLSGWRDNPIMPDGLLYEGVSDGPLHYSGGSAAQSTILHCIDEVLGICHSPEACAFLHRMRDYMPPFHKAFVSEISSSPSVRQYILSSANSKLCAMYDGCVAELVKFRNYHITVVSKYITIAAANAKASQKEQDTISGTRQSAPSALEQRGTGGSSLMCFLKNIRDTTKEALMNEQ